MVCLCVKVCGGARRTLLHIRIVTHELLHFFSIKVNGSCLCDPVTISHMLRLGGLILNVREQTHDSPISN